jgi:hypothetical protein
MSRRSMTRPMRAPTRSAVRGLRARRGSATAPCGLRRPDCPHRAACEREALSLERARGGSRVDFDAVYDRYFALFYQAAGKRVGPREQAEAHTRELLEAAFSTPRPLGECAAAHLFGLVKRLGAAWTTRSSAPERVGRSRPAASHASQEHAPRVPVRGVSPRISSEAES